MADMTKDEFLDGIDIVEAGLNASMSEALRDKSLWPYIKGDDPVVWKRACLNVSRGEKPLPFLTLNDFLNAILKARQQIQDEPFGGPLNASIVRAKERNQQRAEERERSMDWSKTQLQKARALARKTKSSFHRQVVRDLERRDAEQKRENKG